MRAQRAASRRSLVGARGAGGAARWASTSRFSTPPGGDDASAPSEAGAIDAHLRARTATPDRRRPRTRPQPATAGAAHATRTATAEADAGGTASPRPVRPDLARVHPDDVRGRRRARPRCASARSSAPCRRRTASRRRTSRVQQGGVGAGVRNSIARGVAVRLPHHHERRRRVQRRRPDEHLAARSSRSHGVPFIPIATMAVGRRVYFVAAPTGRARATGRPSRGSTCRRTRSSRASRRRRRSSRGPSQFGRRPPSPTASTACSSRTPPATSSRPPTCTRRSTTRLTLQTFSNAGLPTARASSAPPGPRLVTYRYDPAARAAELRARERRGHRRRADDDASRRSRRTGRCADQTAVEHRGRREHALDDAASTN